MKSEFGAYRCSQQKSIDIAVSKVLYQCRQKVSKRAYRLQAHLIENAKPDTMVFGCHLQRVKGLYLRLFFASVFDESDNAQSFLFIGEPFRGRWPVRDNERGSHRADDSGDSFDDKKPSPSYLLVTCYGSQSDVF